MDYGKKRQALTFGLAVISLLFVVFTVIFIINISRGNSDYTTWFFMFYSLSIVILNLYASPVAKLNVADFKKQKILPWISCFLSFIFTMYLFILLLFTKSLGFSSSQRILLFAMIFSIDASIILCIFGIKAKIIENKITYEEHMDAKKEVN